MRRDVARSRRRRKRDFFLVVLAAVFVWSDIRTRQGVPALSEAERAACQGITFGDLWRLYEARRGPRQEAAASLASAWTSSDIDALD